MEGNNFCFDSDFDDPTSLEITNLGQRLHCKMKRAKLTPKAKFWTIWAKTGGTGTISTLPNWIGPYEFYFGTFSKFGPSKSQLGLTNLAPTRCNFWKKKNIKIIFFFQPYFVLHTIPYNVFKFSTVPLITEHRVTQRINRWLFLETWAWAACDGISRT